MATYPRCARCDRNLTLPWGGRSPDHLPQPPAWACRYCHPEAFGLPPLDDLVQRAVSPIRQRLFTLQLKPRAVPTTLKAYLCPDCGQTFLVKTQKGWECPQCATGWAWGDPPPQPRPEEFDRPVRDADNLFHRTYRKGIK